MQHILSATQFSKEQIEKILFTAEEMEAQCKNKKIEKVLSDKIVACLFFEPSTRTRLSFESATLRLGGSVIDMESGLVSSSAVKGETVTDTIRIVSGFADAIVIRHPQEGSAELASQVTDLPIINAGDGGNQHPTQALLDLYTIKKEKGRLENLNIAMVGDLLYGRTIHSTLTMLSLYKGIKFYFVAPKRLGLPQKYKDLLEEKNIIFEETENLESVLPKADVIYLTRVQKERFAEPVEYEQLKNAYIFDAKLLGKMKTDAIVMHALPRVNELAPEVDVDPRAAYFRQARNGLFVRMSILQYALGLK